MDDKNNVADEIRKYLNGGLDAAVMHQLERAAQDDPFLMDAMEGYELAAQEQAANLADLEARLAERIAGPKVPRMALWKYYAAAASVLMVFSLGYLLWPGTGKNVEPPKTALAVQPAPADHPVPTSTDTAAVDGPPQKAIAANNIIKAAIRINPSPQKEVRINETAANADTKAVAGDAAPQAAAEPREKSNVNTAALAQTNARSRPSADTLYYKLALAKRSGRDSAVLNEITVGGKTSTLTEKDIRIGSATADQSLPGKVNGAGVTIPQKVNITVMNEMGLPLTFTRIDIDGMKEGTKMQVQTDANGMIAVPASGQAAVSIISPGYESRQVKTTGADVKVSLKTADAFLLEAPAGFGAAKTVKTIKEAHPLMGWEGYYRYLNAQAISSDGSSGTVELTFTVDAKGQRSNFLIINGLTDKANQRAIALIKNGPGWAADVSVESQPVRIRVHFSK